LLALLARNDDERRNVRRSGLDRELEDAEPELFGKMPSAERGGVGINRYVRGRNRRAWLFLLLHPPQVLLDPGGAVLKGDEMGVQLLDRTALVAQQRQADVQGKLFLDVNAWTVVQEDVNGFVNLASR